MSMFWPILMTVCILGSALFFACLRTRRLLSNFKEYLSQNRALLEDRLRQRRNLIPALIALEAGRSNLEKELLETLDNAAELVVRSQGFDESLVAENRLSSALRYLRNSLRSAPESLSPDLMELLAALNDREAGVALASETYNRQIENMIACFRKTPFRWLGPLCGYRQPAAVEIRLSTAPPVAKARPNRETQESAP